MYIDGSVYEGMRTFAKHTGFAVVVASCSGDLIAYGNGIPPQRVQDAAGAEAWAFVVVLRDNPVVPDTTTDCLGILTAIRAGKAVATAAAAMT